MPSDDHRCSAKRPVFTAIDGGRLQLERELLSLLAAKAFDHERFDVLMRRIARPSHAVLHLASSASTAKPEPDGWRWPTP
jgi:hypothetical protein